jgi:hypothetical protein
MTLSFFLACQNVNKPTEKQNLVHVPKKRGCVYSSPDTSISKIILRDSKNATSTLGNLDEKSKEDEKYHFYSTMYRETLTMTQRPGDGKYSISIFEVKYSDKADYGYRKLQIDTFKTEKGIKLGLTKNQVIEKLGACYVAKDSSSNRINLYYKIETPNDTKSKLLKRENMPMYFASYVFFNGRLERFEFGYEYP